MDVSAIANLSTSLSQAKTADAVQVSVLKKALDVNAQGALQLIAAASNIIPVNPPNLGTQIDIKV